MFSSLNFCQCCHFEFQTSPFSWMITEGCLWNHSSTDIFFFFQFMPPSCFCISLLFLATLAAVCGRLTNVLPQVCASKLRRHFLNLTGFSAYVLNLLLNFTFRSFFPSAQWLYSSLSRSKTFQMCSISSGPVWHCRLAWGEIVQLLAGVESKRRPSNSQCGPSGEKRQQTG